MSAIYDIGLSVDGGSFSAAINEVENHLNTSLTSAGYLNNVRIRITIPMTLKSGKELTEQEIETVKKTLIENCNKSWNATIAEFRRKSGNVQQSAE